MADENIELAVMAEKINYIEKNVKEIKEAMQNRYVTRDQFEPVKRVVYGMVTVILMGVIGAVIGLVII